MKATSIINKELIDSIQKKIMLKYPNAEIFRVERGVNQVAKFWKTEDGTPDEFSEFCTNSFMSSDKEMDELALRIDYYFEILKGNNTRTYLGLNQYIHLDKGPVLPIDEMFSSFDVSAHINDDLFQNKIAFVILLNFPHYSLTEKNTLGKNWNRKQWLYARIGDEFTSRVPAKHNQEITKTLSESELYISEYNIYAGNLVDNSGKSWFPEGMKLLSHWNLRDEIKANYGKENSIEKQAIIYQAMKRIILQEIPQNVVNNASSGKWNPYNNQLMLNNIVVKSDREPDTRYQHLLNAFKVFEATDNYYSPDANTYIKRAFEGSMEVSQSEVEEMFVQYASSEQVKRVSALISKRLGRPLEPFDIWYDGFKTRSNIDNALLDKMTIEKYPDGNAFENGIPILLKNIGFDDEKSKYIASKIAVDGARGSGHAVGAAIKGDKARLRTRIGSKGLNYKGYNVAMHELGHCVEQTISLYEMDYYELNGVPNTAFTEALAFIFQRRDIEMLGLDSKNNESFHLMTLDNFWSVYEIMGVSLVDMNVWKWLYQHPNASAPELREAVINISKNIWNKFYAPVFGKTDEPILAIYSHMISSPLYLSNYPYGHIIDFQIEQYISGKNFGAEIERMYKIGKITPQAWMQAAVGNNVSILPMLNATNDALKVIN